jgi:2-keto-4-pentenoate hydratase/2-oxohepta-3-ene-1,7-dioic acid hydratase in catechol pathway
MKLGIAVSGSRRFVAALVDEKICDLSGLVHDENLVPLIRDWNDWRPIVEQAITNGEHFVFDARWSSPLPNPPKFLLLAGNFRAHVVESGFEAAPEKDLTPQFFMKPSTAIIGPTDDIPLTSSNHALDYEAELAIVIGTVVRNATRETAMNAVWGYTVVNDVSERKLNDDMHSRKKRSNDEFYDWLVGKWFDGSAPMGPFIVTADEMGSDTTIRARLNGETVQEASTTAMIHTISEAIVYISKVLTLEPGDVIAMGTPAGVGLARGRLLQTGDVIECEVDGIGSLRNRVCRQ